MIPAQTIEEVYPTCIGSIPYDADCSRARHGILFGLQAAFPGHLDDRERTLDALTFGHARQPDKSVPVLTACQVDDYTADLMAQWVRGFCCCFVNYRS